MKKLKKLIPAFCMLLVSVAMLGTSTFAWFSMNKAVSATGMQITAKSDSVYLLIMEGEKKAEEVQTNNSASVVATNPENTAMLPAAHEAITKTQDAEAKETDTTTYSNWYYQTAKKPTASAAETNAAKTKLTTTSFSQYVLEYTYTITLAKGSLAQGKLTATAKITAQNSATGSEKTIAPVTVLVTTTTKAAEFTKDNMTTAQVLYTDSITDTTAIVVKVYIYLDGKNDKVFTNNITNLDGAQIDLTFNVVDKAA
ncbi:MAG: hypothetical protein SO532_05375 [Candidatus Borkfalkiaceae bacterium]|nr:hypothetical protein [Christensenellaceae bacterium]